MKKYLILFYTIMIASSTFAQEKTEISKALNNILKMDANNDGIITRAEWNGKKETFTKLDQNGDGVLTAEDGLPLKIPLPQNIKIEKDIVFKRINHTEIKFDRYILKGMKYENAPAVIYIHGGGFMHGDKQDILASAWFPVAKSLIEKGCICFSINYRLADKQKKHTILDCVTDCKDALRFIVKNAQEFGIDPSRIGVWGTSAGGHLALMMLLTADKLFPGDPELISYSSKISCVVDWFGPTDFTEVNKWEASIFPKEIQLQLFGVTAKENLELYKRLSPIVYLSDKAGPILVIHGDKDSTVNVSQARRFLAEGKKKGAIIEYVEVTNAKHRFLPQGGTMSMSQDAINQKTIEFIFNYVSYRKE